MVSDCYFVRLSFGLKDCRAARANGAHADSILKTDGFKPIFSPNSACTEGFLLVV